MKSQIYGRRFFGFMLICVLAHLVVLFAPHFLFDESFYATIPYRLVAGDSLVQDEWHLSQFSSMFSYLPVLFWMTVRGTTDGIILFLRFVYLLIHAGAAIVIFRFFREYKNWSIAAALLFFIQVPYKIYAISYNSMFALFLLLLTLNFLSFHRKNKVRFCIGAGIAFGACCVCNPLFCVAIPVYFMLFLYRAFRKNKTDNSKLCLECFFNKQFVLFLCVGITVAAVVTAAFFFCTGGTLRSISENIGNMFESSEYGIMSNSFLEKLKSIWRAFDIVSLHMPFLLPGFLVVLICDEERYAASHRAVYLLVSILLSALYIVGMVCSIKDSTTLILSFPLFLLSVVCYCLTKNRNKELFTFLWCPCASAGIINTITANTILSSAGVVLAIGNVAGVIFVHDLYEELRSEKESLRKKPSKKKTVKEKTDKSLGICRVAVFLGMGIQFLLYVYVLQFAQLPAMDSAIVSKGPYQGMLMSNAQYSEYKASMEDLDLIKERSKADEPVLVVSFQNWMYLYSERPIATYTTWFRGRIQPDSLARYYKENPQKVPKHIYVVRYDGVAITGIDSYNLERNINELQMMFDFTEEELTNGVLLTVSGYNEEAYLWQE